MLQECAHGRIADCRVIEVLADHSSADCTSGTEIANPSGNDPGRKSFRRDDSRHGRVLTIELSTSLAIVAATTKQPGFRPVLRGLLAILLIAGCLLASIFHFVAEMDANVGQRHCCP